ncbi:MAG: substrate-binding domain-containing protein [Pseudomonadota bacterium]
MHRRAFVRAIAAGLAAPLLGRGRVAHAELSAPSVEELPALKGELTLYLGQGEGGLYERVLDAIEERNPEFTLHIRRGPTAGLANAIVAEGRAGARRADVFWAVDSGAIGLVGEAGLAQPLPADLTGQLRPEFRYDRWAPVAGRIRTLPYHTPRIPADGLPTDIMALPASGLRLGWAPAYGAFQSFLTAMRLLEGDDATAAWLQAMEPQAKTYAGELGVVLGVERGEIDAGLANHYYTMRLKAGKPDAEVAMAFTRNDAGCLINASGILALAPGDLAVDFIRYLFTRQVQSFLASEAYEIPLANGVSPPSGLPDLDDIAPPRVDLARLADLRPTLDLMRHAGVL